MGRSLSVELLEPRVLLTVSPEEQLFVYALNRARHSPTTYQQENNLQVDLSYVQARPPLAVNDRLFNSSEVHAKDLATNNYFEHFSPFLNKWPNKLARETGYVLPAFYSDVANNIESLAAGNSGVLATLSQLIVDEGESSLGHRNHLLGIDNFNAENREIGVAFEFNAASTFKNYWAIHATHTAQDSVFLTGVVYNDSNHNQRFDLNEGLGGVTVTAGSYSGVTNAAGGWSIAVPNGTYTVQPTGGGYTGSSQVVTTVNGSSVEVDFVSGVATGYVDFSLVQNTGPNAISLTNSALAENLPAGTTVGTLSATDPTPNDTISFSLVAGTGSNDNARFNIANNILKTTAGFDYEVKTSYAIRIRATDSTGQFFDRQFTIGVTDVADGLVINTPAATTVEQRPVISWTPVSGAQSYEVWISQASGTTALIQTTVNSPSFTPADSLGIGKFRVWVRAIVGGVKSQWSAVHSFTVNTPVVLNTLVESQRTMRPVISWTAIPGAAKYDLWMDDVSRGISQTVRTQILTGTSFTTAADLSLGRYNVWVRGVSADGTLGKWSLPGVFQTMQAPSIQQSVVSTFDRTPTFTWGSIAGGAKYEFFLRNLATGATTIYEKNLGTATFTPTTSLADGAYQWWAIAVSRVGVRSFWSAPTILHIGGKTSLLTPSGTASSSKPVFTWNTVAGIARYDLYVSQLGGTPQIIRQENLTQATYTPTTALPTGSYRSWIRAISATGEVGPWRLPVNFNV